MITFGSPSRYYQGVGCLDRVGPIATAIAMNAIVIVDAFILPMVEARLEHSFSAADIDCQILPFSGDVTSPAIAGLLERAAAGPSARGDCVVVGVGGGKAIDIAKAVAHMLEFPVITIPTAAANDAATSKNYVIYDEGHMLVAVQHLPANPHAVIVDTKLIATAPRPLLVAGIGDALTKSFEASQCYVAGGRNMFGARPSLAAKVLAEGCYRTVRQHAIHGLSIAGSGETTPAFEELLEAIFLMGGLGFESGGLSIAHAMTRGMSQIPEAAKAMHGHQVAYGLLVQCVLENMSDDLRRDLDAFYRATELSRSLKDLGVTSPNDECYRTIAVATLAAPHASNFIRELSVDELVAAMRVVESDLSAVA